MNHDDTDFSPAVRAIIDGVDQGQPFGAGVEPGAQQSVEWLMERCGHCTASRFKDVLDYTKGGKEGAKRRKYRMELIVERLTGKPTVHYVTDAMQNGTEREPAAKMAYAAATGAFMEDAGFLKHPTMEWVGGSPDSLIGEHGGLECKAPTPGTHIDLLLTGDVSEYVAQCQGLMWITGRQYWELCSYCPDLPDEYQLFTVRLLRDDDYIAKLEIAVADFLAEIQFVLNALSKRAARDLPEKEGV